MALPQLATAKYELTLPSTGEKVEYRPFLVKEEKILMIAQATGKQEDILRSIEQIIDECTFKKLKVQTLPLFDLEYMFLQLRSKSVGAESTVNVNFAFGGSSGTIPGGARNIVMTIAGARGGSGGFDSGGPGGG